MDREAVTNPDPESRAIRRGDLSWVEADGDIENRRAIRPRGASSQHRRDGIYDRDRASEAIRGLLCNDAVTPAL